MEYPELAIMNNFCVRFCDEGDRIQNTDRFLHCCYDRMLCISTTSLLSVRQPSLESKDFQKNSLNVAEQRWNFINFRNQFIWMIAIQQTYQRQSPAAFEYIANGILWKLVLFECASNAYKAVQLECINYKLYKLAIRQTAVWSGPFNCIDSQIVGRTHIRIQIYS